jgi:hypothetical protein
MKVKLEAFLEACKDKPAYSREGQNFMNKLSMVRKDLGDLLMENGLDPFYDDSRLPAALAFVKANW